ncbi:FxLYD domain-containing protein [Pseudomonas sp. NMI760_13]|uniref:FxLYD domain-containing protein n=1 Tax=Pseudomonas sp. NMI760_13 TaxID=2903147 RepID=UPI001E3BABC9|nr:FxLYD domain-containing protein [Pseudomonas sp. NMI760_13]MCE0914712.1 FxLYD domain-containing protein [Pseudomonas sp. NMI760_13]
MIKVLAFAASLFAFSAVAADKVTVSGLNVSNAAGYPAVEGLARNNTNATLANVFVKFKLYNPAGQVVGNTIAHGQDIGPGETWKFSAPATGSFSRAELSQVQAF